MASPRFFIVLLLLLSTGCAAPQSAPRAALVAAAPAGLPVRALASAAQAYARAGGETVQVVALPQDSYIDQVSAALLAGLDRYDLVWLPAESLAKWAGSKTIRPLDAALTPADRADLAPWLGPVTVGGVLYGLPAQPDPLLLWYRADWLAAAGLNAPPRTWQEFDAAARALNAPPERYGAALAGGENDAALDYAAVLAGWSLRPVGAWGSADPGALAVGETGSREALALYGGWFGAQRVTPPGAEQAARADVVKALAQGRAAMGLAPLSAAAELLDCPSSPKACVNGKPQLAAAWLPGSAACRLLSEMAAWAVPLHAAHPESAQRFAAWLVSDAGARAWEQGGGIAPGSAPQVGSLAAKAGLDISGQRCYEQAVPPTATAEELWTALNTAAHAAASGQNA
ncbi:MAG TPA: extracellular solute-binding protein, partial [Longimicrobiales bacterium]